jgi:cell division cycle protein 20 (cofactor of APC complex)
MLSAEKSRMEAIDNHIKGGTDGNIGNANSPINGSASSDIMTPIQSEYLTRMRGALLNIPVDNHLGNAIPRSSSSRSNARRQQHRSTNAAGFHNATPSIGTFSSNRNLAYDEIPCQSSQGRENVNPYQRMLSFQSSVNDTSFTSLSSSGISTPSHKAKKSFESTPDPYRHDQLRVFDRAGGSSMFVDPAFETALRESSSKTTRKINAAPTRILDAPELVDDYYLNLISWGKNNLLAVALGQSVYLWNASTGDIQQLLTLTGDEDFVTSVRWADIPGHTNYLAVGTNEGPVQLWDADGMKKIRTMRGHAARVGSLAWSQNILSSGGRDSVIIQHDVRSASHIVSTYAGHTQEVCGLEWNEDGTTLASGGNENYLCIWDAAMSRRRNNGRSPGTGIRDSPRLLLTQHQAAVKALAWCPFHRGLLASGGGTADRTIKFWNSNSGAMLNSIDTGSQVCSLLWSKHQRELCSSHGFSENQLILWRYPTMTKIQEFKGHTARVRRMPLFLQEWKTFAKLCIHSLHRYSTWNKVLTVHVWCLLPLTKRLDSGMFLALHQARGRQTPSQWVPWELSPVEHLAYGRTLVLGPFIFR